jgi:hypothetical protein
MADLQLDFEGKPVEPWVEVLVDLMYNFCLHFEEQTRTGFISVLEEAQETAAREAAGQDAAYRTEPLLDDNPEVYKALQPLFAKIIDAFDEADELLEGE